MEGKKW